ncbi:MAG: hypothetical protein AB8H79_17165 [Myxococcota bacterium]
MVRPALPPIPAPPKGAPWGRRASLYNFDTASLLGQFFDVETLQVIQRIARASDEQLAGAGGGFSHGWRLARLARESGVDAVFAQRCGVVMDIIFLAVDLADNVADAELDAQLGRSFTAHYDGIGRERLVAMPALLVGAATTSLSQGFAGDTLHGTYAAGRVLGVLAVAARGQSRAFDDPARIEEISAAQGRLYALPWWILEGPESPTAAELEPWGAAWARTWQLRLDVRENPGVERCLRAFELAYDSASQLWPTRSPFRADEPFAQAFMLPPLDATP